ncbi:MAG: hypothetical protein COA93_05990 [Alphaproteobacteria bacterium]|nr:MAG: hypothetical protein COA93_05990 [Alphaproteobacteria bacterium]
MAKKEKFGRRSLVIPFVFGLGFLSCFPSASLAEGAYSYNSFGGIGLLDMRTARFAPDGTLAVGVDYQNQTTRYFATWQATPWLETTLSYADENIGRLGVDRSFDVKVRLMTEGNYRPQLAIGLQDALGSGSYAAEYIVASKRYYDFDFTMGFAWGYLGSRGGMGNMFRLFGDNFDERSETTSSGGVRTGSFFSGKEMAFFAGAEYFPPVKGLSVKIEYSGVDTTKIDYLSHLDRKTAFNIGINYKPTSWADITVGLDHGDQFGIRFTLKQNLRRLKFKGLFKDRGPVPIIERRKAGNAQAIYPGIPSLSEGNDLMFDRLRHLGAKVTELEQKSERIILKIAIKEDTDIGRLTLLGAVLESYEDVIIHMSHKGEDIGKYQASRADTIGQMAIENFRKSAVYLRSQTQGTRQPASHEKTNNIISQAVFNDMEKASLILKSIKYAKQDVVVKKETGPYFTEIKNIGRTARILTRNMPDNIEKFTVISEENGVEVSQVSVLRKDLEKANRYQGSPEEIWANSEISVPGSAASSEIAMNEYFPEKNITFNWGFKPEAVTHFGGNNDGRFRGDIYAKLFGSVQVTKKLKLSAELKQFIVGDIDKIPGDANSNIPNVRSDIARYAREGRTALERMTLDYNAQIGQNLYARVTGGLLESMFGGIGAEFLYRPYQQNFAFGVDINWVKQRNFNQLFSFRDYETLTGHVTYYHENTTYNITSKISAGRYLAGDYGATFDISRRFSNGIRIGVWATVTDMSSNDFGDGSFDKGIYMTLPLEIFWYQPTRERMRLKFRSLGKNGGQMLDKPGSLYDMLSSGRKARLAHDWREILD